MASQLGLPAPASIQSCMLSGWANTSTMWWHGPTPRMFSADCMDLVPVRPRPEPTTFNAMIFSPKLCAKGLIPRLGVAQCVQTASEIGDQVGGVFQADVQAHQRPGQAARKAAVGELVAGGNGQAFEAAPGKAQAEQAQGVEHGVDRGAGGRVEDNAQKPVRAGE